LIYIITALIQLPKLKTTYKDGDYLKFLRSSLSGSSYNELVLDIKDLRKDCVDYYSRNYTTTSCSTEYITNSSDKRNKIKSVLQKHLTTDIFDITYEQQDLDLTIKEYIFLQ